MSRRDEFATKAICQAIVGIYGVSHVPFASPTPTQIHNEPLASAAVSVAPNLMFILDDSGSMASDFTPDYVNDALCRDAWEDRRFSRGVDTTLSSISLSGTNTFADNKDDNSTLDTCVVGDPSFTSPNFNFQWYNPATTYTPGYDPSLAPPAPGTNYNMQSFNTAALWAAVEHDPYPSNNPSGTRNVINGNVDVVFCNTASPTTAQLFDPALNVCKEPVDTSVAIAAEAAGTGVWRYPRVPYAVPATTTASAPATLPGASHYAYTFTRTGSAANPLPPYFYTISQVIFCVNRNGSTTGTRPAHGMSASKSRFGKGSLANLTDRCSVRRFNDGTNNFQFPRFGLIPYSSTADTQALNQQEPTPAAGEATDSNANRWAGMSGFRKHQIVDIGGGVLPATYPSRADAAVYGTRSDCSNSPCTYAQEMTNFANWYAYYRNRMLMMKTAAGKAFFTVDDKFRVGFITINPQSPVTASRYLALRTFDAGHKSAWYAKFYQQVASGGTPLREALARVGRHYAGKTDRINSGMGFDAGSLNPQGNPDSMIASCQQNFALLTTDGYWTTASSAFDGIANTGWKVDGTTRMDDQDETEPRPFFDGPGVQNTSAGTSIGTLADVAMYYYKNDLRPAVLVSGQDIWANNVPTTSRDTAPHQHMTTFTLGLGLEGVLNYQANYDSTPPPAGDFADIVAGTKNWPVPSASGNEEKALDDLWHAAVNGRGKFFSARDPNALAAGLAEALTQISAVVGAGAAAATSNLQPSAGDNWAFTAEYETGTWHGDLKARTIDLVSGIISSVTLWSARDKLDTKLPSTRSIWMFTSDTANFPDKVKPFTWTNAAGAAYPTDTNLNASEQAFVNPSQLAVANGWNAAQSATARAKDVVDFLRGDTSKEDTGASLITDLFRDRVHVLGDIVQAQPIYIKGPPFSYSDNGYAAYKSANAGRRGTVYIASNDGMVHAIETDPDNIPFFQTAGITTTSTADDVFSPSGTPATSPNNDGGGERWAYIPSRVLPNLYKLAEKNYTHRWYVDGTPIVEDVCATTGTVGSGTLTTPAFSCPGSSSWKAILVGGLNGGGRGFYALDVTDPLNPKGLWEFNARNPSVTACAATTAAAVGASNDCDLGLSYGNALVTKLPLGHQHSGKWVVLLTSGYNNHTGVDGSTTTTAGDGNGYLYILDALAGTIIEKLQTCTGSPGTGPTFSDADPCGFARINTYHPLADEKLNNSPVRVYGVDLKGQVWRIDLTQQSTTVAPTYPRVQLVATLKDGSGTAQPITTPPELFLPNELTAIGYSNPWHAPAALFVGTGRYLGTADRSNTSQQSIYAIKDVPGVTTPLANARTGLQTRTFSAEFSTTDASGNTITARDMSGCTTDSFTAAAGWFADFPQNPPGTDTGERVNVDSRIVATTWIVPSNIPAVNACTAGGSGFVNFIDVNRGCAVQGLATPYASQKVSGSLIVGVSPIQLGDKIKTIVTTADNQQLTLDTPIAGATFAGRRVQWRELLPQ